MTKLSVTKLSVTKLSVTNLLSESFQVVVVVVVVRSPLPSHVNFLDFVFIFGLSYSEMRRLLNVSLLRLEEMEEILTAHFYIY